MRSGRLAIKISGETEQQVDAVEKYISEFGKQQKPAAALVAAAY
jgi:hypothetical protein